MVNTPKQKATEEKEKEMERRNVNIDSRLVDGLKIIAIQKGITLKDLCDEMARDEIKKNEKEKKKKEK